MVNSSSYCNPPLYWWIYNNRKPPEISKVVYVSDTRQQHNRYQQETFDVQVDVFRQVIAKDIQERTRRIVAAAELMPNDRILDVGTGIGVLIPDFHFFGVTDIVGCDISSLMLAEARVRFPEIDFWCGDVIDLPHKFGPFDVIYFNAMFGNVCDQRQTLEAIRPRLTANGRIIISHPMGASFQAQLQRENSRLVPHLLPNLKRLNELIAGLTLRVHHFADEDQLYLCCLKQS